MTPVKFKEEILRLRSPQQWAMLIEELESDSKLFEDLIKFAFDPDETLSFRASWIMDKAVEKHPDILSQQHIDIISDQVIGHFNFSVTRACLRLLSREKLTVKNLGRLTNQCFNWLVASSTPIAVKVHAMQLLYRVALLEPDFKNELKLIIEEQLPHGSAGFKSRGKKILKLLEKIS